MPASILTASSPTASSSQPARRVGCAPASVPVPTARRGTAAWLVAAAASLAGPSLGATYPTVDRVEYVLECMKNNGGSHAYLYKCSCAIDAIAEQLPYDDYVAASAVARYQAMGGERAGLFRDPEEMRDLATRYRAINADAKRACEVGR